MFAIWNVMRTPVVLMLSTSTPHQLSRFRLLAFHSTLLQNSKPSHLSYGIKVTFTDSDPSSTRSNPLRKSARGS